MEGQCPWCGEYRELNFGGGLLSTHYCSQRCFEESGAAKEAAESRAARKKLMYYDDSLSGMIKRSIIMMIGWFIWGWIVLGTAYAVLELGSIPKASIVAIPIVTVLQNLIMRGRKKFFRCIILYGLPVLFPFVVAEMLG